MQESFSICNAKLFIVASVMKKVEKISPIEKSLGRSLLILTLGRARENFRSCLPQSSLKNFGKILTVLAISG